MADTFRPLLLGLGLSVLVGLPAGARAQFRAYQPSSGYGYVQTQATAARTAAAQGYYPGYNNAGYWGCSPYYCQTPMNGFLTGAADVINATGQYEMQHQESRLTRQQVKSAWIDNRRKMFDELAYEKANTPPLSANMAADWYEQLQQARNNPPQSEIWEAIPLNLMLQDIRQIQSATGMRGALVPLEPDVVKHLSLTVGNAKRSSTMLNNGGKLKWPPELDDPRFDTQRQEIDKLYMQAVQEAGGEGLSGRTRKALNTSIEQLQDAVTTAVSDMTPSDNIRAMSYVNQVAASSKLLSDPNIAKQLNGDWAPKGNTVDELIENMNKNGQKFGPAGPDSKPYYSSFYLSLLRYDLSLAQMASPPSPGARQ
jgi:hypothetical protein